MLLKALTACCLKEKVQNVALGLKTIFQTADCGLSRFSGGTMWKVEHLTLIKWKIRFF